MRKIKIPLDIVEIDPGSYHIFINCFINGNKHDMLIDTGASRTVFDMEHFSESKNKILYDEILSSGLSPGNLSTNTGILRTFSISHFQWKNVNAVFMDLGHINELYKRISNKRIAGLIGGDFLVKAGVRIDYEKKSLSLKLSSRTKSLFV